VSSGKRTRGQRRRPGVNRQPDPVLCRIDWRALDLEPPDELDLPAGECPTLGECRCPAVYRVVQGCPHEHIVQAVACGHCVAMMRTYEPFDRWACAACLHGADGHQCVAPVLVELIGDSAR
jgi:hypothetical protein